MNEETPVSQNVRSLQIMLRTLSFYYPALPSLIPNGTFGEDTLEAVMTFQREFGLPVTGVVDNATWDAIVLAFTAAAEKMAPPRGLPNLPSWQYSAAPGVQSVYLLIVQAVFQALSGVLNEVTACPISGVNSPLCAKDLRWLQRKAGLPETGALGKAEWDFLTRLYALFILRDPR